MQRPILKLKRMASSEGLDLPAYETSGAAGLDLRSVSDLVLAAGERGLVPTGLMIELPSGHEAQVRPRSGLAVRHGITVLNAPGTIDEDYRGEIQVPLVNLGQEPFEITRGMRVAQLVVAPVTQVDIREAAELTDSDRGTKGFGSTGSE